MDKNDSIPKWLERAKDHLKYGDLEHFTMDMLHIRLKDLLVDSCFYLSAGADITPIVGFKDQIYTYILCDKYLYDAAEGINNSFLGILVKIKDRLNKYGFTEIQKFNLDKHFLGMKDIEGRGGYIYEMKNCEISFWSRENKIYCVLYINHDNTLTYKDLYIKNGIVPKAICEIIPDGGSMSSEVESYDGRPTLTVQEKNNVLPEYVIGYLISVGNYDSYETLPEKIDYLGSYGGNYGIEIHKRK